MAEFVTVGKADEVAEGAAKSASASRATRSPWRAWAARCTPSATSVPTGAATCRWAEVEGTTITCECHGSVFDMTNGAAVEGPATEPVATFEVREEGGDLQVGV